MIDVVICSAAEKDYAESLSWYAERSKEAAAGFDDALDQALSSIAKAPERFPKCDERHRYYLMRRHPFRIIYRLSETRLQVIAIAHTSRDPEYWKDR